MHINFRKTLILFLCLFATQGALAIGTTCVFTGSLSAQNITPAEAVAEVIEGMTPIEQVESIVCNTQALKSEDLTASEAAQALVLGGYPLGIIVFNAIEIVYGLSKNELTRLISGLNRQEEFGTIPDKKEDGGGGTVTDS